MKKAKINLISKIVKQENIVSIEIKNNKISYQEEDKTLVLYHQQEKRLIRENDQLYMEFDFKNDKAIVYIKSLKKETNLKIKTNKIIQDKNLIDIDYYLEDEHYQYKIQMEEKDEYN